MNRDEEMHRRTSSWFFSPRALESTAFRPTAVPLPRAAVRVWIGADRDTALRAASPIREIYTLSTRL